MKRRPVEQLVYECMIPRPKPSDPPTFQGILTRYLVFEVRQEVHSFYGHINTQEARYPGLDYCHPVHRVRLSRWPWHRRLFRAFDALQLTAAEVASLTKWEGTKWAKERYEKEQGITIRDSATDGLPDWRVPGSRWRAAAGTRAAVSEEELASAGDATTDQRQRALLLRSPDHSQPGRDMDEQEDEETEDDEAAGGEAEDEEDENEEGDGEDEDNDESDMEIQSIGLQLNERLLERVAAHNAGDTSQPLDEDWEQWLKNAIENGNLSLVSDQIERLAAAPTAASLPADVGEISPPRMPRMPHAERQGNWDEVPDFLRDMVQASLYGEMEESLLPTPPQAPAAPSAPSVAPRQQAETAQRRTYSDLRLPASERSRSGSNDVAF